MINHIPKETKMMKQNANIVLNTFGVQKRRDLKTVKDTKLSQIRSISQWTAENSKSPKRPNIAAFSTSTAPIVAHDMKKYGFAPVAIKPATKDDLSDRLRS
jgi:hypothetical protein